MAKMPWYERWDLNPHALRTHEPQSWLSAYSSTLAYYGNLIKLYSQIPMAESQGFEPWVPCGTTVFKTVAFVHSANSPYNIYFVAILIASAFNC